jgi:hypothetical protein
VEEKAVVERALEVAEEALESREVRLPEIMHMKTDLLNCIGDVWPGEGELLKGPSETPVCNGVSHRGSLNLRQLALSIDRSGAGIAVNHPSPLQDIPSILPLVKK